MTVKVESIRELSRESQLRFFRDTVEEYFRLQQVLQHLCEALKDVSRTSEVTTERHDNLPSRSRTVPYGFGDGESTTNQGNGACLEEKREEQPERPGVTPDDGGERPTQRSVLGRLLSQASVVASQVGSVKLDNAIAAKMLAEFTAEALRREQRDRQLQHRLKHYHQQLREGEEDIRQRIANVVVRLRNDRSALGHVDLVVFDVLHRLLNDLELVAIDENVILPTPEERVQQSLSDSESIL